MRVLTTDGTFQEIRSRSWPLAGLQSSRTYSSEWSGISLLEGADGDTRLATFAMIYKTNPWVWACCQRIAGGVATVPLKVYELLADGQRKHIRGDLPGGAGRPTGGQQLDNLLTLPAPQTSQSRLVKRMELNKLIYGNGMWSIEKTGPSVTGLYHVPWRRVAVVEGDQLPVIAYEIKGMYGKRILGPEEVVHFIGGDDLEAPVGVSPLSSLRATLTLFDAIARHLIGFYGNRATPSGILSLDKLPNDKELQKIRETIRSLYSGPENAGRVLVTSGKFQAVAEDTGTPALIDLIRESRVEVCAAYGIAPPLVGILDRAIKSNVKELRSQFYRDVIGPEAESIEDELGAQLLPQQPSWKYHFVEFDLPSRLRPEPDEEAIMLDKLKTTMSLRERRRKLNLPDLGIEGEDLPEQSPGAVLFGQTPTSVLPPPEPDPHEDPGVVEDPDPDDDEEI